MKLRRLQMGADYAEDEKQNSCQVASEICSATLCILSAATGFGVMCEELCADLYPSGDSGSSGAAVRT